MPQLVAYHDGNAIIPPKCASCQVLKQLRPQVHAFKIVVMAVSRDTMSQGAGRSHRPSPKELAGKLVEARTLINAGMWRPASVPKLQANFEDLETRFGIEIATREDQTRILLTAVEEATPDDYCGTRPPQKAYEDEISGQDLFAFSWKSANFGAQIYFKFAIKGADKGRRVYPCSIHESK